MKLLFRSDAVCHSVLSWVVFLLVSGRLIASEPAVSFDVPAMLPAHELIPAGVAPVSHNKIIEVIIPVTAEILLSDRENVSEFRFDVSWNGHSFPVADYGPKSQTVSHIDGTVTVDQSDDSTVGIGLNGRSDQLEIATLTGSADLSRRSASRKTYQEIPQHHPVIASGTIERGTGTFFRFHRSRTETLEGGRDVVVAYRVGRDWRGGILKVECRAVGQRKLFGAIPDDIAIGKAFVVPVYIEGDVEANQRARDFVVAEQGLRRHWHRRRQAQPTSAGEIFLAGFHAFAQTSPKKNVVPLPWVHQLIQSGDDHVFTKVKAALPPSTAAVADQFVSARKHLLELAR